MGTALCKLNIDLAMMYFCSARQHYPEHYEGALGSVGLHQSGLGPPWLSANPRAGRGASKRRICSQQVKCSPPPDVYWLFHYFNNCPGMFISSCRTVALWFFLKIWAGRISDSSTNPIFKCWTEEEKSCSWIQRQNITLL